MLNGADDVVKVEISEDEDDGQVMYHRPDLDEMRQAAGSREEPDDEQGGN